MALLPLPAEYATCRGPGAAAALTCLRWPSGIGRSSAETHIARGISVHVVEIELAMSAGTDLAGERAPAVSTVASFRQVVQHEAV